MNLAIIIGNLGNDPEQRTTASGQTVCNFNVATSERVKGEDRTEWHRIVTFGPTAETCARYLGKGRKVAIRGRLSTSSWDKDGVKHYRTEIIADRVDFLDSGKQQQSGGYGGYGR